MLKVQLACVWEYERVAEQRTRVAKIACNRKCDMELLRVFVLWRIDIHSGIAGVG